MSKQEIYCVDFDNTISLQGKYPDVGKPNTELIEWLNERQAEGHIIILWTCRCGEALDKADRKSVV